MRIWTYIFAALAWLGWFAFVSSRTLSLIVDALAGMAFIKIFGQAALLVVVWYSVVFYAGVLLAYLPTAIETR